MKTKLSWKGILAKMGMVIGGTVLGVLGSMFIKEQADPEGDIVTMETGDVEVTEPETEEVTEG